MADALIVVAVEGVAMEEDEDEADIVSRQCTRMITSGQTRQSMNQQQLDGTQAKVRSSYSLFNCSIRIMPSIR